ncbi:MAG: hypothetical protein IPG50_00600 [Myxococcales bacterium]|nr:hypothetical protein [Myxococcales bacterium]
MADEKKPKIDLKARLGKNAAGGATPPPAAVGTPVPGAPVPVPAPPASVVPPVPGMGGVRAPVPGVPVGRPANMDASNPLVAAFAQPAAPQPAPPPQAQRIEVDEMAVQQARKGAQKQGLVIAAIAAVAFAGVGYVGGQASEAGAARAKSKADASELAADVAKTRASLESFATKIEEARTKLIKERKYPDQLGKELGGINIDFDGTKLAGRRFSGFPQETTSNLVEFVTQVQQLNDRKRVLQGLLSRLQKPLTEQFNAPPGEVVVQHVIAVSKDPAGNMAGFITNLAAPIKGTAQKLDLGAEFTFANPGGSGNANAPVFKGGDLSKQPGAIYVVPGSFNKVCPSETSGATAQLGAQMQNIIRDVKGDQAPAPTPGNENFDAKPGLLERADKLAKGLQAVNK